MVVGLAPGEVVVVMVPTEEVGVEVEAGVKVALGLMLS